MATALARSDADKAPPVVQLRNAHDFGIVIRSLEEREQQIEKLAKKNEEEGYHREARTQHADAAAIKQFILPALRGQAELPLVTGDHVRTAIADRLRVVVRPTVKLGTPSGDKEAQEDAFRSRETRLVEQLAVYVELVTIAGSDYVIADIGMRMLAPRELYTAQGFPGSYLIDIQYDAPVVRRRGGQKILRTRRKWLSKTAQVKMCGNSVCPPLAAAIVRANFATTDRQEVAA